MINNNFYINFYILNEFGQTIFDVIPKNDTNVYKTLLKCIMTQKKENDDNLYYELKKNNTNLKQNYSELFTNFKSEQKINTILNNKNHVYLVLLILQFIFILKRFDYLY